MNFQPKRFIVRPEMPEVLQRAIDFLFQLPKGLPAFEILIRTYDPNRTQEQNALAHIIVTEIAEQVWLDCGGGVRRFHKDVWWVQLKKDFFGLEVVELPDGTLIEQEPQSRKRGKSKFSDWIDWLYHYAADNGVVLDEEAQFMYRGMKR